VFIRRSLPPNTTILKVGMLVILFVVVKVSVPPQLWNKFKLTSEYAGVRYRRVRYRCRTTASWWDHDLWVAKAVGRMVEGELE
jgi:hypothetical protein